MEEKIIDIEELAQDQHNFTDPSRAVTIQPNDPLYQGETVTMLLMPMLVND